MGARLFRRPRSGKVALLSIVWVSSIIEGFESGGGKAVGHSTQVVVRWSLLFEVGVKELRYLVHQTGAVRKLLVVQLLSVIRIILGGQTAKWNGWPGRAPSYC